MQYLKVVSVYDTIHLLNYIFDENITNPDIQRVTARELIESHLKYLYSNDGDSRLKLQTRLSNYIPTDQASDIDDLIHDELLMLTRSVSNLDEDEEIVSVYVSEAGDAIFYIRQVDRLIQIVEKFDEQDFGRHDVYEQAFLKALGSM